jgi:hypothetical protein
MLLQVMLTSNLGASIVNLLFALVNTR